MNAALKIDPNYAPGVDRPGRRGSGRGQHGAGGAIPAAGGTAPAPSHADVQLAWGRYHLASNQVDAGGTRLSCGRANWRRRTIPSACSSSGEVYIRHSGSGQRRRAHVPRRHVELDSKNRFAQYGLGVALAAAGKRDEALGGSRKGGSELDSPGPGGAARHRPHCTWKSGGAGQGARRV